MSQPDQSVEDILASIKRIIVDEDEGASSPSPAPASVSGRAPAVAEPTVHQPSAEDDDVLELTRPLPAEPPRAPAEPLVSSVAANASRQALASLSGIKVRGQDPADDTLAGLVRELLKPLLKDWLDSHLPAIVERAVVQEIARLQVGRD